MNMRETDWLSLRLEQVYRRLELSVSHLSYSSKSIINNRTEKDHLPDADGLVIVRFESMLKPIIELSMIIDSSVL